MKFKRITSGSNISIKEAAKLKRKRNRYARHLFLTEGEDLLDAALKKGVLPRQVFVLEGYENKVIKALNSQARTSLTPVPVTEKICSNKTSRRKLSLKDNSRTGIEFYCCSELVLAKLSQLSSGSRVVSVFEFLHRQFSGNLLTGFDEAEDPDKAGVRAGPLLYLAGIGDPGNIGSLIRSAAALGSRGVILGLKTADPYSPKALRATMGSIFQVPLYLGVSIGKLVSWAAEMGLKLVCADPHSGIAVWDVDLVKDFVLVLGSERGGVPGKLKAAAPEMVRIPQTPGAESINVAMAGTAVLYEAMRQRQALPSREAIS